MPRWVVRDPAPLLADPGRAGRARRLAVQPVPLGRPVSRRERDKGAAGEREVAAIFRAHGFDCDRVPNSGGLRLKGDLYGELPVHVEVKRQERTQVWAWWEQAAEEAGAGWPVLAFRRNRSEWLAVVRLDDLVELLAK